MCLQDRSKERSESCAFTLKIPEYSLPEVLTVFVACCENNAIPGAKELDQLQPLAFVLIPGSQIHAPPAQGEQTAFRFFESVLISMLNVKDIIICTHSGCKFSSVQDLEQQLNAASDALLLSPHFRRRGIQLHGWHYEPEINWVSFFDLDTRLMLPLNANINLCQ